MAPFRIRDLANWPLIDVDIIGNYFISGPSTGVTAFTRGNENFHGYVKDNFYDPDKDGTLNGNLLGESASNYGGMDLVPTKYDCPAVATALTPEDAVASITKCTCFYPTLSEEDN